MVLGEWGTENHIRKQNEELEQLKQKTAELKEKAVGLEEKAAGLEEKAAGLEEKAAGLEEKAAGLEQKSADLEQENIELKKRKDAENRLAQKLLDAGKIEELKKMLADGVYRQELLEEYHLISENEK